MKETQSNASQNCGLVTPFLTYHQAQDTENVRKAPCTFVQHRPFLNSQPLTITGFSCIFNCSYQTPERWRIAPSKPDV